MEQLYEKSTEVDCLKIQGYFKNNQLKQCVNYLESLVKMNPDSDAKLWIGLLYISGIFFKRDITKGLKIVSGTKTEYMDFNYDEKLKLYDGKMLDETTDSQIFFAHVVQPCCFSLAHFWLDNVCGISNQYIETKITNILEFQDKINQAFDVDNNNMKSLYPQETIGINLAISKNDKSELKQRLNDLSSAVQNNITNTYKKALTKTNLLKNYFKNLDLTKTNLHVINAKTTHNFNPSDIIPNINGGCILEISEKSIFTYENKLVTSRKESDGHTLAIFNGTYKNETGIFIFDSSFFLVAKFPTPKAAINLLLDYFHSYAKYQKFEDDIQILSMHYKQLQLEQTYKNHSSSVKKPQSSIKSIYQVAVQEFKKKEFEKALVLFERILEALIMSNCASEEELAVAHYNIANTQKELELFSNALANFKIAHTIYLKNNAATSPKVKNVERKIEYCESNMLNYRDFNGVVA